jgi:hypothetical protein
MDSHTPSLTEFAARLAELERKSREPGHPSANLRPRTGLTRLFTRIVSVGFGDDTLCAPNAYAGAVDHE